MGAEQDFNKPAKGNPTDSDLDQIRDNFYYLLKTIGFGSIVAPGWTTKVFSTASPQNFGEPNVITLTNGSREIRYNFTWAADAVASVQFCYNDGVSSPGLVCSDIVDIVFDSSGNLVAAGSAFDDAISDLAPDIWFRFDDADLTTTIVDYGSQGINLTSQNTTNGSAGAPLRTTRSQSLSMPAWTATNWATEAAHYTDSGNAASTFLTGVTARTVIFSINQPDDPAGGTDKSYFSLMDIPDETNRMFDFYFASATETLILLTDRLGGNSSLIGTVDMDDGVTHLVIGRYGNPDMKLEFDGTEDFTAAWAQTLETETTTLNVGGHYGTEANTGHRTDCFVLKNRYLSNAEIVNLFTLYSAEL